MITKYHIRLSVMVSNQIWLDCRNGQIGDTYKMILNETKTKSKQATGKWIEKRVNKQRLQIKLNATELKQVNSQKILVSQLITNSLLMTISTNSVIISSVSKLSCLVGLRNFFLWNRGKRTTMIAFYVSSWNLQRVFRLQKRCARV